MNLLLVHAAATVAMTGLIWFVQVVHYPLFHHVAERGFAAYEERHTAQTTWVVLPLMAVELGTAAWLVLQPPPGIPAAWTWCGLGLVLMIWLSTAALQVPCHQRLTRGYDRAVVTRLVRSNWIRTVGWTARALLAFAMVARAAA